METRNNMLKIVRINSLWLLSLATAASAFAQTQPLTTRQIQTATVSQTPALAGKPTPPSNLTATGITSTEIDLTWGPSTPQQDAKSIAAYQIERCEDDNCNKFSSVATLDNATTYRDQNLKRGKTYRYRVIASDDEGDVSDPSNIFTVATTDFTCQLIPLRPGCVDWGNPNANVNAFYETNGGLSFFRQIKSIYNGASGSATVSADLATLNFADGMQVTATTNAQVGSAGAAPTSSASVPTLSATGAAQATQNMLYGGTALASELYPLLAEGGTRLGTPGGFGVMVDVILKQGVDIQNFKAGSNVNVSSPPFHASADMEGYLQYNSINLIPGAQIFAGALFVGGSYGWSYMSHSYARDYGFTNVNNGIGQISFGILINNVAKITISRGFGPSQTYMDSTTSAQTTVNNFKAWSFGIAYQSPPPSSKQ